MSDVQRLYVVDYERVGRDVKNVQVTYNAVDADDLAEQVYRFARRHLASRDVLVTVDLEKGTGSINFGRFGVFTIEDRGEFRP